MGTKGMLTSQLKQFKILLEQALKFVSVDHDINCTYRQEENNCSFGMVPDIKLCNCSWLQKETWSQEVKKLIEEENNQKEKILDVCYDVDEDFVSLYLGDEFISEFCFRLGKPKDFAKKISKCTKNKIKYEDVESGKFIFYENGKLIKE